MMVRIKHAQGFVLFSLLAMAPAFGQIESFGPEVQVNSYTTSTQDNADVAVTDNGDFLIAWRSHGSPGDDDQFASALGRAFSTDGLPVGDDFQVNSTTPDNQSHLAVAAPSSGFAIVWRSGIPGDPPLDWNIFGQVVAVNGAPVGREFQVSSQPVLGGGVPAIAAAESGFVVVWSSFDDPDSEDPSYNIQGRRFESNGDPVGSQFQLNAPAGRATSPRIARSIGKGFVVVWNNRFDTGQREIVSRRFDEALMPLGDEVTVAESTGILTQPDVARNSDGNFVVTWLDLEKEQSVRGQAFDVSGQRVGAEFGAESESRGSASNPKVTMSPAGDFVVAWTDLGVSPPDEEGISIQMRLFRPNGKAVGNQMQANSYTTRSQSSVSLAQVDGTSEFIATWHSELSAGTDTDNRSIQKRRFRFSTTTIFSDGFESGNVSGWSAANP